MLQNLYSKSDSLGCLITSKIWASYRDIESRSPGIPMSFVSHSNTLNHWRGSEESTFGAFETNRQSYSRSRTNVGWQTGAEHLSRATDKNDATRIVVASQEKSSRFLAEPAPNGLKHSSAESREQIKAGFVKNYES